ncbi:MAG: hypothetical protein II691_05095 [Muribaculaceae bacterium]|nr:hypothetical protein [Muribaculaceae bacterium]MBQ6648886.1 hypothetical protein [Muribaculaceae bacterium]
MKHLISAILLAACVATAGAKVDLPEQSVVVPGYSEQVAREQLLESDLQPLEGIWYYPAEDMTLTIERWQPEPSHKIGYRLLLIASDDLELIPGTVIGYIEESAVDNKFHLWLYSERNKVTLCGPLECVATLNKEGTSLTFDPPHWEVKVRVNFARFLPTLFKGVSVIPDVEKERLPIGFKKIFPADGNGNKFNRVRYL